MDMRVGAQGREERSRGNPKFRETARASERSNKSGGGGFYKPK